MRPRLVLAHRSRPPLPRSLWGAHQPRCLLPFLDVPPFIHLADASLPATQLILSSCISGVFLLSNFHAPGRLLPVRRRGRQEENLPHPRHDDRLPRRGCFSSSRPTSSPTSRAGPDATWVWPPRPNSRVGLSSSRVSEPHRTCTALGMASAGVHTVRPQGTSGHRPGSSAAGVMRRGGGPKLSRRAW